MTSGITGPEFEDAENLLAANRDATTISIGDPNDKPSNQRRSAGKTPRQEEDLLGNEDSDKTELLAGQKKSAPFWTFEYYQTFFDVDTDQVLNRIKGSVLPLPGKNFVRLYIRSNPDLYGPFWICATLVFAIAISGNISSFLVRHGDPHHHYVPEFRKVTIAATAIYSYAWLVPLGLWGFLMWRNSKVMSIVSYSFLEIVCVYGYSLFIYIPAAVLWVIPNETVRWVSSVEPLGSAGVSGVPCHLSCVSATAKTQIKQPRHLNLSELRLLVFSFPQQYFFDSQEVGLGNAGPTASNQTVAAVKAH
uniref:Protein YIPF n=1 Tax=Lepisosteus oculatus TaxID=7918 RepID=W5M5M0_LEPOC